MCQITLTSILGLSTNNINTSSVVLSGTAASQCQNVKLVITGCNYNAFGVTVPVTNGNWQYTLVGNCDCGRIIEVVGTCCDAAGNPVPGCNPVNLSQAIKCASPDCCLNMQVQTSVGDCNASNQRPVTFNVTITAAPGSCPFPYVVELDYGDGNYGPTQYIPASGTYSFSPTHLYNANASYTAKLHYIAPTGLCPDKEVTVDIGPCVVNCCPQITDVNIHVGDDCNADCQRLVQLLTHFEPPAGSCQPVSLEWKITDKNGQVTYLGLFNTGTSSPHPDQIWLSSAGSPYSAELVISYPDGCDVVVRKIGIPECLSGPPCPVISNFGYAAGGCVAEGERCCREVSFSFDADVKLGCGAGPKPKVRLYFGDGAYDDLEFGASGQQHVTFTHRYCQEGDYDVTLETLYPATCPPLTLKPHVEKCDPAECNQTSDDGSESKFCPCCIGLLVLVTSYFFLWTEGYYQGDLIIFSVKLGSKLGYASFLFTLLLWLLVTFCYKVVKACKKCWQCRFYKCMFYALLLSILIIIVMVVIAYYYGNMAAVPEWLPAILSAISSALIFYALMKTEPCKTFYVTGKCKE